VKLQLECVRDIYFNEKKETAKICEKFWKRRLFNSRVQHGNNLRHLFNVEDGSGFRNFVKMTKIFSEILVQKIGSRIQRRDTKYRKAIPA
jgi:hypothetical protein